MLIAKTKWALATAPALIIACLALAPATANAQDDCCTDHLACQDGRWCTGIEYCNCWGVCVSGTRPNCEDGDPCTVDNCIDDVIEAPGVGYGFGHCEHANICITCFDDLDCDDGDDCTTDHCSAGSCVYSTIPGCCNTDTDCNDSNPCTTDTCSAHVCSNTPIPECCTEDSHCDDTDPCTIDTCLPDNTCSHTTDPSCCTDDADCDDGLYCNGVETCTVATGVCNAGTDPCAGGLTCDECDEGTDSCVPQPGYCIIGGVCYTNGTYNPTNNCQHCSPGSSPNAWTARPDGSPCTNDGLWCTGDECSGGSCTHPINAGTCLVSGTCYNNGQQAPVPDECTGCVAATSQTAFSNMPSGTACSGDSYTCTSDVCDGGGSCTHDVASGWCLIGTTCYTDGTTRPMYECQWCDDDASRTAWSNKPAGTACTADSHSCTSDICDASGTCTHPIVSVSSNDTCGGASALSMSGTGINRQWTGSGDTYCANDNYSSSCGGAGYPDTVHYFDIPTEYDTYRYRAQVAGPSGSNTVEYFYGGNTVVPGCGQSSAYIDCNNDGSASCWSPGGALGHDGNDSCWHYGSTTGGRTFNNGRNWLVVDSIGAGDNYQVKVDRIEAPDISSCNFPMPELQLGGTFTGTTCDPTMDWVINMPYCVASPYYSDCYYFNIYHINHAQTPFNGLNRGYVIWTDGTQTSGGFDNVAFFSVNRCDSPWYLLSCDDDTYHYQSGWGHGSKIVTGKVPAGRWGGIVLTSYNCYGCGNYTLRVEIDDDGDGVPNSSDGSSALLGSYANTNTSNGAKPFPTWPYGDHGYSYDYPSNSLATGAGREVYYTYVNSSSGRDVWFYAYPRVRGDVWSGAASNNWDMVIYVYRPEDGWIWADGYGWYYMSAGWVGIDMWGSAEWEAVYVENMTNSRYYFAIDSWTSTPRGGWYTVEFR